VQNLYYAFLYQDISKEAIMLAADTLLAQPMEDAQAGTGSGYT
jgi:hypothetical protein